MRERLARWLDLRPDEIRAVALSFLGAFFAIGFVTLSRALSDALYLTSFPVRTLPYIIAAVAVLSIPVVGAFTRAVARVGTDRTLEVAVVGLAVGVAVLWPLLARFPVAVVIFYLWTAIGALVLTSGFWLVAAEIFPVREAKRVFGLVGAGGTTGAMVTGNAVALVSGPVGLGALVPALLFILVGFLLLSRLLTGERDARSTRRSPEAAGRGGRAPEGSRAGGTRLRESWSLAWRDPHLRTIALIVAAASVASTLVDYQLKEAARATFATGEALAGFFGAFYGWTGAAALAVQVLVAGRLLARRGLSTTLSALPAALLIGAVGFLIAPGLVAATLVRGSDSALRKSLHRSAIEVLYVPIPTELRRKTKTFIDSIADSAAEGTGALVVFLLVTLAGLPSRTLSIVVAALAVAVLWLAHRARVHFLGTVASELREEARARPDPVATQAFLTADRVIEMPGPGAPAGRRGALAGGDFHLPDAAAVGAADSGLQSLRETARVDADGVSGLIRLLARDSVYREVTEILGANEAVALPALAAALRDSEEEFVIRRRIPAVLARFEGVAAEEALLDGIASARFEVRYRSAVALLRRRAEGRPPAGAADERLWAAIRAEVSRERPVWEFQRLLDEDHVADDLVAGRLSTRGHLSLEHTFRLLSLVLDPEAVASAYQGLAQSDERLRSLALEYLDQVLPAAVRDRLWPFIGDLSEHQRRRSARPLDEIVSDLVTTSATFIAAPDDRSALRRRLDEERPPTEG